MEIQKKSVITYATFGYLRLRVNYGVITDAVITDFITLEPCAAVEAAAAGALGADRKRVVHGDDDSGPKSAEIDDVERKPQLTGLRILDFLGSFG